MKRSKEIDELAARLTAAATQPLIENPAAKKKKTDVETCFLRLNRDLYDYYNNIAISRTKETGKGVSIQQIIIEQLEKSRE